jgi:hypothetical protein
MKVEKKFIEFVKNKFDGIHETLTINSLYYQNRLLDEYAERENIKNIDTIESYEIVEYMLYIHADKSRTNAYHKHYLEHEFLAYYNGYL